MNPRVHPLERAARIADERARICREEMARWPETSRGAATERSAAFEAELIARLIRERMQPRRRRP